MCFKFDYIDYTFLQYETYAFLLKDFHQTHLSFSINENVKKSYLLTIVVEKIVNHNLWLYLRGFIIIWHKDANCIKLSFSEYLFLIVSLYKNR